MLLNIFRELPQLAQLRCARHGCGAVALDFKFGTELLGELFPSPFGLQFSVGNVLEKVYLRAGVPIHPPFSCKHKDDYEYKVSSERLKAWCERVDSTVAGLCFCSFSETPKACQHEAELKSSASADLRF